METRSSSPYRRTVKYLLYGLLLFSPLARGSVQYWHHTVIELFSLTILFILLLEKGITGRPLQRPTAMDKPIVALLVLCVVGFMFSMARLDSFEGISLLLSYVVIFYATIYSIRTREDELELVYVICGIGLLLATIGFFKYFGVTPALWVYDDLKYPASFMAGVFGNHNHLAGYLEMMIPLVLTLFLTRSRSGVMVAVLVGTAAFLIVCHILTLSRGGWVALGVSLTFMTAVLMVHRRFKKKRLLALLFCSSALIGFFILSGSDSFLRALTVADEETVLGMGGRVIIWQGTLQMIKAHLFLGTGPGTYATIFPQFQPPGAAMSRFYEAHNDYLHYLAELGILFLPVLGWLLFVLFRTAGKKLQSSSRQTWGFALGAMTGIVAILAHSFVDFNLHIPANALLFTVLAAMIVGGPKTPIQQHRPLNKSMFPEESSVRALEEA